MILVLRALARLLRLALLVALAAAGLAAAVGSLSASGDLSIPGIAAQIGLPSLETDVGRLLGAVEAEGPIAVVTALAALGAVVVGIAVLIGALAPRREPLVVLDRAPEGRLAARRRAVARLGETLAETATDVTRARAHVRGGRRRRGRIVVRVDHPTGPEPEAVRGGAAAALGPLAEELSLRTKVRTRGEDAPAKRNGA